MRKNNKGFTLIELIIVIAIIGCLVSLLVPSYLDQLENARVAKNKANAHEAAKAAQMAYLDYYLEYGDMKVNSDYSGDPNNGNTVTYTYFVPDGVGVWNFRYYNGKRWVVDGYPRNQYYKDTNMSNWKSYTRISDNIPLGKYIATIWTIHLDPSTGEILGYYCAYPKPGTDPVYKEVIAAIRKGDTAVYGGTVTD